MMILLPRFENNAVDKLINQLSEETLHDILEFDALYAKEVEVEIPKFVVEQSMDLRPVSLQFSRVWLTLHHLFKRRKNEQ